MSRPVGLAEVAELLGVTRGTVDIWRHRGLMPDPDYIVGNRPAWEWSTIYRWAVATDRFRQITKQQQGDKQ